MQASYNNRVEEDGSPLVSQRSRMNSFPPARKGEAPNLVIYDCEIDLSREIKPLSWVQGRLKPRHFSLSTQNSTAWLPAEGLFCTVKISLLIYTKSVILNLLLLARWKQGKLDLQEKRRKKNTTFSRSPEVPR